MIYVILGRHTVWWSPCMTWFRILSRSNEKARRLRSPSRWPGKKKLGLWLLSMSMCWEKHTATALWRGIDVWHTGDANQMEVVISKPKEWKPGEWCSWFYKAWDSQCPRWLFQQNNWDRFLLTILSFKSRNDWEIRGNSHNYSISEWEETWNACFFL